MRDRELHRLKSDVDSAFGRIKEIDPGAIQLQAEYARYLCVRTSGLFEVAVQHIFSEHSRRAASRQVARYAATSIGRRRSMATEELLQLIGAFDPNWRVKVEAFVVGERKDAIDSIVANRHAIAHGTPTGITYVRIQRWYELALEVLTFLEDEYIPA